VRSTYKPEDVTMLLKDITGQVEPLPTEVREKMIQRGKHYSEMLPLEYEPTEKYIREYKSAISDYSEMTARAVCIVAEKIFRLKGKDVVIVSIARSGIPAGILIKRYLEKKYSVSVSHYTVSIIRGRGIDHNAMKHMLNIHKAENLQFVDGWTGKGAILKELKKGLSRYPGVSNEMAVIADPARITNIWGTLDDFLIPSSCLNSTVSGLISRTFLRDDIIGKDDFHGAIYYKNFEKSDVSQEFIDSIEKYFDTETSIEDLVTSTNSGAIEEVQKIADEFDVRDINFVKPGVGETTRVLLRRIPWKILVNDINDTKHIGPILRLAKEKGVEVVEYPMAFYRSCGIIKELAADV